VEEAEALAKQIEVP